MSRLRRAWQLLRHGWPRPVSPDPLTGIYWVNGPTREEIVDRMTGGEGRIRIPVDTYQRSDEPPPSRMPTTPNPVVMEKRPRVQRAAPSYEAISIGLVAMNLGVLALVLAVKL